MSEEDHCKLVRQWSGQIFFSSYSSHSRGVAIMINRRVPFVFESMVKDNYGRYIILKGYIASENVTIANVYAPNQDDPQFFHNFHFKLFLPCTIIGGDFNLVLDSADRSPNKGFVLTPSARVVKHIMAELELLDIWRALHNKQNNFSFYSRPHKSFSRIDLFLLHKRQEHLVESCEYLPRTLSDHSPLVLTIYTPTTKLYIRRWRFSNYLLNDPDFIDLLNNNIENFLNFNAGSATSGMIWESLKAYLRGIIIAYSSRKRKNIKVN